MAKSMEFFQKLLLIESEKAANRETDYAISIINKVYNDWKKVKRRINAIDIIASSVNRISSLDPAVVDKIHAAARQKLVIIIMRCLDTPLWKPVGGKEKIYKKLFPMISKLQNDQPNSGTTGSLREVIMTRLSAAIAYEMAKGEVWVAYEPKLPASYIRFLFGENTPAKTYRMASLPLPDDFSTLIDTLRINQEKAMAKFDPAVGMYVNR